MDTQKTTIAIRRTIGELHRRRHPAKGEVVEFAGFHEEVARRTALMKRLNAHEGIMLAIRRRRAAIASNERRWGHIRAAVTEGAPFFSVNAIWEDNRVIGVELFDGTPTKVYVSGHPQGVTDALWGFQRTAKADGAYVVLHDEVMLSENLASVGVRLPAFKQTIDLAQVTAIITGEKKSSLVAGQMVGVKRDDHESFNDYLWAVARAYVALPSLMSVAPKGV